MKIKCRNLRIATVTLTLLLSASLISAQNEDRPRPPRQNQYTIEQATSERAQLHTMAFSGLAFLTGSFGADCFFPPGKVADFFGFQYMRDNDKNAMGHNTDFLTRIATNVLSILTPEQLEQLKVLANKQAPVYDEFAQKRMVLIKAFRESLENGKTLNREKVIQYAASLYGLDAELSYDRAITCGKIIVSLTDEQKSRLKKLDFSNSSTWPELPETLDKRSLSHRAHVAVMTYASELFSWYAGSVTADVYFCPERHGTYFGGFYLKDFPAMGNKGYNISTALTGDKGRDFIEALTPDQSACLKSTIQKHIPLMQEIVITRESVALELRKAMTGQQPDKEKVFTLIKRYGELDGELSYDYATCFTAIGKSLTDRQKAHLKEIRNLDVLPKGTYLFSDPLEIPEGLNCGFLTK